MTQAKAEEALEGIDSTMDEMNTEVKSGNEDENTEVAPTTEKAELSDNDAPTTATEKKGLKVLFLSSDTGGGHRASAESLARQFQLLYPGSTYDLLDVVEKDGVAPYNSLVGYYKHLSSHPAQWKLVYSVSNSRAFEMIADAHLKIMCERAVRRRIKGYDPDVVISVHPLMTNVPILSCKKITNETGKHLPMFTVVTDLGSAHCLWFANGVEKMFVGSDQIYELAKNRGKVPDDQLVKIGLPIRHDFAEHSEKLGDRMSEEGKAYQKSVQKDLGLPITEGDCKTILVMGGGEGCGALSNIVDALYCELVSQGIDSQILVVCGRNDKLKKDIDERDWNDVIAQWVKAKERKNTTATSRFRSIRDCATIAPAAITNPGCIETTVMPSTFRRILSTSSIGAAVSMPFQRIGRTNNNAEGEEEKKCDNVNIDLETDKSIELDEDGQPVEIDNENVGMSISSREVEENASGKSTPTGSMDLSDCNGNHFSGQVKVAGLGFVTRMAEYMVAADVLVSKAGPGTISEAAALSLPIMLTSYLPGQEEGNVDYVVENEFGAFCPDKDPSGIAEELCMWLSDSEKMRTLSQAAKKAGAPYAARDIAKDIGERALKWREINDNNAAAAEDAEVAP